MLEKWRGHAQFLGSTFRTLQVNRGKITLASSAFGAFLLLLAGFAFFEFQVPQASADDVQTSVTVLNTPPTWNGGQEARESVASATTTPTNSGTALSWIGTATDSSDDPYYMIICKTAVEPTANASAPPTCNGGASNQWAVSPLTASNVQATATVVTTDVAPFHNESNDWWGWVCDGNAELPRCYSTPSQGAGFGDQASPFVINHVPFFTAIINDGPADPGETVTWFSTASDNDTLGTQDQVRLFICRDDDFTGTGCGAGGSWATSTFTASNPATTTQLADPMPDGTYDAYVYVIDNHNHMATSTFHGSNSSFVVNNIAPTISAATISLADPGGGNLNLSVPNGQTTGFTADFVVSDDNSCQNLASGNEIASAIANVYRSSVGSASCQASTGHYNANSCYPNADPLFSPHISCVQSAAVDSCSGINDATVGWRCTFSLWYTADPTVAGAQFPSDNWLVSVRATDDDTATSSLTEDSDGTEMDMFLAFDVPQTGIAYPSLEPGQFTDPLTPTTTLLAYGNVGLDEDLYGDTMCRTTEWTAPDSCDINGINPANDIPIDNQQAATSSVSFSDLSTVTLSSSTTPVELLINVPKTTATSSPESRLTYWGINIPGTITTAGDYEGQNTITAITSNAANW